MNRFKSGLRKFRKIWFHWELGRFSPTLQPRLPTHIQLETTVRCNLHCSTCTRDSVIDSYSHQNMNVVQVESILNQLPNLKSVKLQGLGEPLLTADIENILQLLKSRRIRLWTITNGTLLESKKYRKLLTDYFTDVTISIDSTQPELFNKLRKGADFTKVIEGLKLLIAERDLTQPNLSIGINCVIGDQNNEEVNHLEEFAVNLKVDYISIVPVENWTISSDADFTKRHDSVLKMRKIISKFEYKLKIMQLKLLFKGIIVGYKGSSLRLGKCSWPFRSTFINVEGEMTPCCLRMHRDHSFGNVIQGKSISEVWNGEKYKSLRNAHRTSDFKNQMCGKCPL